MCTIYIHCRHVYYTMYKLIYTTCLKYIIATRCQNIFCHNHHLRIFLLLFCGSIIITAVIVIFSFQICWFRRFLLTFFLRFSSLFLFKIVPLTFPTHAAYDAIRLLLIVKVTGWECDNICMYINIRLRWYRRLLLDYMCGRLWVANGKPQ